MCFEAGVISNYVQMRIVKISNTKQLEALLKYWIGSSMNDLINALLQASRLNDK